MKVRRDKKKGAGTSLRPTVASRGLTVKVKRKTDQACVTINKKPLKEN